MSKERRQHKRLPMTLSIAKPMEIKMATDQYEGDIPGILVNLSAGGMALIVFHELPLESRVNFDLNFMGIKKSISGTIVREETKFKDTYMVGVKFDEVSNTLRKLVENMAEDHDICDVRFLIMEDKACFPECSFRPLCGKRIKKDFSDEE
ncbi:MAG: PilZ domain-containing protein [Elusimicrobiota bacterium]|nr:PilZ domain-containing protein [Elusimicrobiota bacterium]